VLTSEPRRTPSEGGATAKKIDAVVTTAERAQRRADVKLMGKPAAVIVHEPEQLGLETGAGAEVPRPGTEAHPWRETTMPVGFEAIKSVTIEAPTAAVWEALTDPGLVKEYMHGTELSTDWQVGNPITWSGEWKGRPYEEKGTVLEVESPRLLRYTHWSPLGASDDEPENYHTVSFELIPAGTGTLLTLRQDNNASEEEARTMANDNWGPVLEGLRSTVEQRLGAR
jgi:uncharacterized protein YndB with AHSA1/START domain